MIKELQVHLSGELRHWGIGHEDGRICRLSHVESKISNLLSSECIQERLHLVQTLSYERHRCLVERFGKVENNSSKTKEFKKKAEGLLSLFLALQQNQGITELQRTFFSLPEDVQGLLCWGVWVEFGAPDEENFGRKTLLQKMSLLLDIRSPLIFPNGNGICEQALHHYESLYVLENQKALSPHQNQEVVYKLERLQELSEFERISLIYHRINHGQRQAILGRASWITRESIHRFEKDYHYKERLKSDPSHLYLHRGAHPKVDETSFQVFAPNAKEVHLVLTAFGKEEHTIPMNRNAYGVWEVSTKHAVAGRTYRYRVCDPWDNWKERTDPFSFGIKEVHGVAESVVTDIDSYTWHDQDWMSDRARGQIAKKPVSIYELNVDYWKKEGGRGIDFYKLANEIVHHHQRICFTHVQLYGLIDNRHDYSWGYQANHYLAPNRRMGCVSGFKFLVDRCHQAGIGVFIDMALSHFKHEHAGDLSQTLHDYDGTNLFAADHTPWGTAYFDFNKEETRRMLLSAVHYWLEKTHIDGMRLDAVSPMLYRNGQVQWAAVDFLKELNSKVHRQYPGIAMLAEATDPFDKVTRPVWEGGLGFDANVGGVFFSHNLRNYLKTPYEQRGQEHHFGKLLENLKEGHSDNRWIIAYSHDDAAGESLYHCMPTQDPWRRFADMRLFHGFNILSPAAGHLTHMGSELGQIWPWDKRLTAEEGAVEWHRLDEKNTGTPLHSQLLCYTGDLNRLYISQPPLWKLGEKGYLPISHCASNKVLGFQRFDDQGGRLAVFFNFSTQGYRDYDFPMPHPDQGRGLKAIENAKEIFNSDGMQYGGTGQFGNTWAHLVRNQSWEPTAFRINLPPLSLLVFKVTLFS